MELISKQDTVALIVAEMEKIPTHNLVDGTARLNLRLAKNIVEDMPSVKTKQVKYFDESEQVWKIGEVIVDEQVDMRR